MSDINEVSPPGWGGTTSAMKKHHPEIKNPWALSYWMKNKGAKPHYKNDPEGTKSKKEPVKKEKYKDEDKPKKKKTKFKEWLEQRELFMERKCKCKCKKDKDKEIKLVNNIEGEPTEVWERALLQKDPYIEGFSAGKYGEYPENPYPEGSPDAKQWNKGYTDGSRNE